MLMKTATGEFTWYTSAYIWPYSYGSRIISRVKRRWSNEPLYTKVLDGWYIGAWPAGDEFLPEPDCAVLDCVCELPIKVHVKHYLNLPTWDTFGFTVKQLNTGTEWALQQRKEGRTVYVHCAYGHGRSCTMLCACLVEAGLFPDVDAAFKHINSLRPGTYINERQKRSLKAWMAAKQAGTAVPNDSAAVGQAATGRAEPAAQVAEQVQPGNAA